MEAAEKKRAASLKIQDFLRNGDGALFWREMQIATERAKFGKICKIKGVSNRKYRCLSLFSTGIKFGKIGGVKVVSN